MPRLSKAPPGDNGDEQSIGKGPSPAGANPGTFARASFRSSIWDRASAFQWLGPVAAVNWPLGVVILGDRPLSILPKVVQIYQDSSRGKFGLKPSGKRGAPG